jgi:hypothetical protein
MSEDFCGNKFYNSTKSAEAAFITMEGINASSTAIQTGSSLLSQEDADNIAQTNANNVAESVAENNANIITSTINYVENNLTLSGPTGPTGPTGPSGVGATSINDLSDAISTSTSLFGGTGSGINNIGSGVTGIQNTA